MIQVKPEVPSTAGNVTKREDTLCCVCGTSIYHFGYEPMNLGCTCVERVCRLCVQVGDIVNCPTCRKYRRKPKIDAKWKRKRLTQVATEVGACLGCSEEFSLSQLWNHESTCAHYRNHVENIYLENFKLYRDKASSYEQDIQEMNERLALQEQEIDNLEEYCDSYKVMTATYEAEKRVYVFEQQNVLATLTKLGRPLQNLTKRLHDIQSTVDDLKSQIRASRENHRLFGQKRRRLGFDTSDQALRELVEDATTDVTESVEEVTAVEESSSS